MEDVEDPARVTHSPRDSLTYLGSGGGKTFPRIFPFFFIPRVPGTRVSQENLLIMSLCTFRSRQHMSNILACDPFWVRCHQSVVVVVSISIMYCAVGKCQLRSASMARFSTSMGVNITNHGCNISNDVGPTSRSVSGTYVI